MGYQTKVQLIKRKSSEQWYINFPAALAQAMDFTRGEICEWSIEDRELLVLKRANPPASILKKKPKTGSSKTSSQSSENAKARSDRKGVSSGQE